MRVRISAFIGCHPQFGAALVMMLCIIATRHSVIAGCGLAVMLGGLGIFFGSWRRGLAWLVCGVLALGVFAWRNQCRERLAGELLATDGGWVDGRLLADAKGDEHSWSGPVKLIGGVHPGAKVWWRGRGAVPVAGAHVRANGNFEALPGVRNPGEFDQAAWLRSQGVAAVFHTQPGRGQVQTGRLAALGARVRQSFREAVTAGLPPDSQAAQVIRAVVIGDMPPDADELIAAFRNSGTLHIFSVSGTHVAMVASIVWLLLRWLGISRRWAVCFIVPLIFGYTWISGNSAPALRSAWMASAFIGAFLFRRRPDLLNALGLVMCAMLLWDGNLLFQAGVQLSYGVVAAIALVTPWAYRSVAWMARPPLYLLRELYSRWQTLWLDFRLKVAQSLAVSLAAMIGSTPLTIYHFGLVTPISIIANLVLMPLVFLLLLAAMLAAVIHPVSVHAARVLNRANGMIADTCVICADSLAKVPGGYFSVRRQSRPNLLVYDIDHGAAACFSAAGEGSVLFDCGDIYSFKQHLLPSLRQLGVAPDSVVLSHPDGSCLGGGAPVWTSLPIRQVLLPVAHARSKVYQSWVDDAPRTGIRLLYAAQIASLPMPDGAMLEILHAPDPAMLSGTADDQVMICRLNWHGWKILFTSDAGAVIENELLAENRDLSADVIIAGRHRSDRTLGDEFLQRVQPEVIIVTNKSNPDEARLDPAQAGYWLTRGIRVIDPRISGAVTLTVDAAGNLLLNGFLDKSSVSLPPH